MSGSPQQGETSPAPSATPPVGKPHGPDAGYAPAMPPSSRSDGFKRLKLLAKGRKGMWAAVAVLCVAAGAAGSVLGAHAVARTDATKARQAFHLSVSSTGIASTVKLAVQQEEALVVSASTFFAANPKATPAELSAWARWAQTLRRYHELKKLSFVALVRAPEPAAPTALTSSHAARALASRSAPLATGLAPVVPASERRYYCSAVAELARSAAGGSAVVGHCALTSGLLSLRDSGRSSYARVSVGRTNALGVTTPVYKGGVRPSTLAGRRAAFVGWLHEVLAPGVVLQQALRGHLNSAVRARYRIGSSSVVFTSGTPQSGAQSIATNLHNGWTVRSFGPPADAGLLADGHALALLIGGCLISVLLGLLVFVLGGGRASVPARKTRELPHADLYDVLTGLPNQALTLDRAEQIVARAGRQSGLLAGALLIDIDWFRDINDRLGPAAGDQLLTIVAERLQSVARAGDTVGRLGGDEFVVLVESVARGVRLDSLAGRVIEALHKPVELDNFGPSFFATASIGVAFGRYETPDDLLRDAQLALYAAKAAGKDRYTLFNANMRSVIESRGLLEAELNTALQDKQFFLLYQPIYDLTTRKVLGLEALIRWRHPKRGVLPPGEFIPLAEETALIVPIGRWALEEACTRAAAWNVAGHRVGISVKVSANQLGRDGFATDVRRALQQSGIEPSLLTLEIAEATVMRDVAAAAQRIEEVKQLGVCIAIEDFGGSGYARHSELQRMPLDVLKVDRSSLAVSEDKDYRSWLLEAIVIFGRDLSLTVIATGVETYEQMTALQAIGCTMAQGSLMGEPTPPDGVEGLFDAEFPAASATSTGQGPGQSGQAPMSPSHRPALNHPGQATLNPPSPR
jgi:diguanylate cyclase (GGDEF)-like protein